MLMADEGLDLVSGTLSKPLSAPLLDPGRLFSSWPVSTPGVSPVFRNGLRIGI